MIPFDISSMSRVKAKVDIYLGDTLVRTCTCSDLLQDFKITRVGDTSKFFGFGVIHKLDVEFIDLHKVLSISKANTLKISFGDTTFINPFPTFYVNEVTINQKDFTISVTAYDKLYGAQGVTLSEVGINPPYTVKGLAEGCAGYLGWDISIPTLPDNPFDVNHSTGGNFSGDETLTEVFTAIAEVTQTIYYVDVTDTLTYKRLSKTGNPVLTVTKDNYYELNTTTSRTLTGICSTTELGDNLDSTVGEGTTQYVRNNPLWELREDRAALLDIAINANNGLTINQFYCDWAGNFLLEIGDRIAFATDGNETITTYLLSDILTFNGYLSEITDWEYSADEDETDSNPTSIGAKILQTSAKVDKVNQTISLVAADVTANKSNISQLQIDTQSITASVAAQATTIKSLETADTNLSGQITTTANNLATLSVTVDGINTTVSNQSTSITALQNADATLTQNIEETKTSLASLSTTIDGISASVSTISSNVSVIEVKANTLETDTKALQTTAQALQTEITGVSASIGTVSTDLSQYKTATDTVIDALDKDIGDIYKTVSSHSTQIAALDVTTQGITASVSSQATAITNVEASVTTISGDLATVKSSVATQSTQLATLETTLSGISASVSNQNSAIATLQTTVGTQGTAISTLTTTTATHTTQIGALQTTTESISATVSSHTSSITTLETTTEGLVTQVEQNTTKVGELEITTEGISGKVSQIEETTSTSLGNLSGDIEKLTKEVETKITAEDVTITVKNEIENGVTNVKTTTGYTFDEEGLTVSKSGREMKTQITEDGMTVFKDTTPVLTANSAGVDAKNLNASTYLVIGTNSRFENYQEERTACFWIGGN